MIRDINSQNYALTNVNVKLLHLFRNERQQNIFSAMGNVTRKVGRKNYPNKAIMKLHTEKSSYNCVISIESWTNYVKNNLFDVVRLTFSNVKPSLQLPIRLANKGHAKKKNGQCRCGGRTCHFFLIRKNGLKGQLKIL